MLPHADQFYAKQDEPVRECLLALREVILASHPDITPAWKYGMPFFCFKEKMFCYLWVHKKHRLPYLGIVDGNRIEHPALLQEKRARMKILLVDPEKDLPLGDIQGVLAQALILR